MEALSKYFDAYSRQARLYPALLSITPIILSYALIYASSAAKEALSLAAAFAAGFGLHYFMATLARRYGRAVEQVLLKTWGGWPSTLLLRHRDQTLNVYTKARYHKYLAELTGLALPSADEENTNPGAADEIYRSATMKLIEHRRGEQYKILHAENANYGFRRNLLGLKSFGVLISIASSAFAVGQILFGLLSVEPVSIPADLQSRWSLYLCAFLNLAAVALWLGHVNGAFVREAAFDYAIALFKTIDSKE